MRDKKAPHTEGERAVKKLKFNAVMAAILYLALGVVLVGWPGTTSSVICYVIGAVLLVYGLIAILAFLLGKERTAALSLQMVVGVVAAALGVFFLTRPVLLLSLLPVLMGLFIIIVSMLSVKRSFELRRYRYAKWWVALLMAVAAIALGLLILFHPYMAAKTVVVIIGIVFLYVGVCDLWAIFTVNRSAKKYHAETPIEVEPIDIE